MTSVHENESYVVEPAKAGDAAAAPDKDVYRVYNKSTGNMEFDDAQIANAISYAEHANTFLKYKLWRLIAVNNQANAEFLDKQSAQVALTDL